MNPLIAVSVLGGVLAVESRSSIALMISQPICAGWIMGSVLGEAADGFMAGALFQMMFLGMVTLRGGRKPDLVLGGVTASCLYVMARLELGGDPAAGGIALVCSLLFGLAVAVFGDLYYSRWERKTWRLSRLALKFVARGDVWMGEVLFASTLLFHFLFGFVVLCGIIYSGHHMISFLIETVNADVGSPELLFSLIPFIGIASLVKLHFVRSRVVWFCAGFLSVFVFFLSRG